jgi:hypothetical protein
VPAALFLERVLQRSTEKQGARLGRETAMILTIYCHGTGGSSAKDASKQEIVNLLGNNHSGTFRIITEGPGSIGHPQNMVPTFERIDAPHLDIDGAMIRTDTPQFSSGASSLWGRAVGTAFGRGVENNVDMVYQTIERLEVNQLGRLPEVINMLGWSRGAVTTVRIANRLWEHPRFRTIPLNIFAVDPVAGPGNYNEDVVWYIPRACRDTWRYSGPMNRAASFVRSPGSGSGIPAMRRRHLC